MWTTTTSQLWFRATEPALLEGEVTGIRALMKFLRKKTLCCICVFLTFLLCSCLASHHMWVGCFQGPRDWRKVVEFQAYQRVYTKPGRSPSTWAWFSKEKYSMVNGRRKMKEEGYFSLFQKTTRGVYAWKSLHNTETDFPSVSQSLADVKWWKEKLLEVYTQREPSGLFVSTAKTQQEGQDPSISGSAHPEESCISWSLFPFGFSFSLCKIGVVILFLLQG